MAITVRLRSAWRTREGGLSATLSRPLKTSCGRGEKIRGGHSFYRAGRRAETFRQFP